MDKSLVKIKTDSIIRLRECLNESGITQGELARRTGIDKGSISNYLSGRYLFKSDKAKLMADVFGVSPVWLMGFDVPKHIETKPTQDVSPQQEVLHLISRLSPEQKELVVQLIRTFASNQQDDDSSRPDEQ